MNEIPTTNPSGPLTLWFWNNTINDAFSLTGAGFNYPDHAWVLYAIGMLLISGFAGVVLARIRRATGTP